MEGFSLLNQGGAPQKQDLQLFDPITGSKKNTNYKLLMGITGYSQSNLSLCKSKCRIISNINCFLIDSSFSSNDLVSLMGKVVVETEFFKNIDTDGIYQLSNLGRVRRTYKTREPKFLMPYIKKSGWLCIKVKYNGRYQEKPIHRLVGELFVIKSSPDLDRVIHKNGNLVDNRADNLMWVTKSTVASIGRSRCSVPVLKLDPETLEVLDEFSSIKEAALSVYVVPESIRQCISGIINTSAGFKWIVDEDFKDSFI